ncbi:hypothetical protein BDZ45DRAFT_681542 [Acephala macrosclerotiorum]|nr:hypothetical protein BDZ45DRAFT_681542 [Acephala macrosclerotiorum]
MDISPVGTWFRDPEKAEPDLAQRDSGYKCCSEPIRIFPPTFVNMSQTRPHDQDSRLES